MCDLNTPWDVYRVTSRSTEITTLLWDPESAATFLMADKEGHVEIWEMQDHVITEWKCIAKVDYPGETFLKAMFIPTGRKVRKLNLAMQTRKNVLC